MKLLRRFHVLSGVFFAPLIMIFSVTGVLQILDFHHSKKDGSYKAPKIVTIAADIHKGEFVDRVMSEQFSCSGLEIPEAIEDCKYHKKLLREECQSCKLFPYFIALLGVGMFASAISGLIMAFQYVKLRAASIMLFVAGILVPVAFLWFQQALM